MRISSGAFFFDKKIFAIFLLLLPCGVFSQTAKPASKSGIKPEEKLVLSDSLVFLGIDLSRVKLVSHDTKRAADYKKEYAGEWEEIGKSMCREHNLKYEFSKKKLFCRSDLFEKSYEQIDSDWMVEGYKGLDPEQIAQHIKVYTPIEGYRLGFVFIVEKMVGVANGTVSMYGVYINLNTNTVLKTIKCSGAAEGFGSNRNWSDAIENAYGVFKVLNQDYIHKLKEKFVKNKSKKKTTKKK